jgi:hypothetical protein
MFDPLSVQFTAMQQETYRNVIGQQESDCLTYSALYGEGDEPPTRKRQRLKLLLALLHRCLKAVLSVLLSAGKQKAQIRSLDRR